MNNRNLSEGLINKLARFGQRKLKDGEVFLLSKAISDTIGIPTGSEYTEFSVYIISKKPVINEIIYALNYYTYVDEVTLDIIYKQVTELTRWKHSMAFNPPMVLFSGSPETVIDEISGITIFVETGCMCSVADIAESATTVYGMFRELCNSIVVSLPASV